MALWEHRHKLSAQKVSGWLFVTSYNKALKYLQRQKKQAVTSLTEETIIQNDYAADETPYEELHNMRLSMIEEAVNLLPERKKKVFILYRYEGRSLEDVAHILRHICPLCKRLSQTIEPVYQDAYCTTSCRKQHCHWCRIARILQLILN